LHIANFHIAAQACNVFRKANIEKHRNLTPVVEERLKSLFAPHSCC